MAAGGDLLSDGVVTSNPESQVTLEAPVAFLSR
jgi:hypothetical protein